MIQSFKRDVVDSWTDRPAMTIAVDLGRKATKNTKHKNDDVLLWTVGHYQIGDAITQPMVVGTLRAFQSVCL